MADLFTQITPFLEGILTIINTLLIPTDTAGAVDWTAATPIQIVAWFGLVFLFVPGVFTFIVRIIKAGSGS